MTPSPSLPLFPSNAFVHSAYEHCARICIGLLTSRGEMPPQLFLVGAPARGHDAATSKVASAGDQAMAALHADEASASRLQALVRDLLDPAHLQGRALAGQLGAPVVAVHACHVLAPAGAAPACAPGLQPVRHADGRTECLLLTVHTGAYSQSAWIPLGQDEAGTVRLTIAPLPPLAAQA